MLQTQEQHRGRPIDTKLENWLISRKANSDQALARAQAVVRRIVAERHDRPSLVSQIACEIGAEIIGGILLPGDDLNSVDLARRYKTSRTPIREAVMLLEKEGLVDVPPRRRPRVVILGIAEIREIYRARTALLELIAGDIARGAPASDIASLREVLQEMNEAYLRGDLESYLWANIAFHDRNTQIANNRTVKRIIDSLLLRTIPLRRLSLSQPARLRNSFDDHVRLVKAYEDRDPNLAAALIRSNHMNALATLETCLAAQTPARTSQ